MLKTDYVMTGIGYAAAFATWCVVTYYCCLMALTVFYFFASFQSVLPWSICDPSWADDRCYVTSLLNGTNTSIIISNATDYVNSSSTSIISNASYINRTGLVSSAEQYFT